ncbi:restriction endonuclease subunit S [Nocardia cyriacigeorgica]|uniref:restriction endonuclease subunit S n=1 Tax=Nocardia cyriacigeorgica TaxID=135487 RepID=UPI0018940279|nr:restriction endonuclease subunit S [Nocardia cyriacigeorgica]MBF6097831.1 restriction endonuclease subunit S [Nocardia cyriacigeorgica]
MSRIDSLIAKSRSQGVEFRRLGDVISLNFGTRITKLQNSGTLYPVYGGGGESFRTDSFNRENEYVVSRFAMSEVCVRKVTGKFWMLDSGFTFDTVNDSVNKHYVAYWLLNNQQRVYECSSQGAQKNLKTQEFKKFLVPIPPLEVQHEIVRILDQFTQLETEVEAELDARRRQYAFYRDSLLASVDAPRVVMGDLGTFMRGRRFTKNDVVASGIPSIHYGEIYTDYGVSASRAIREVRSDMVGQLRFAQPRDVIFAGVGETVEDVGKAVAWLGDEPVAVHDDTFSFTSNLNPKYVAYAVQTNDFHAQKANHVARGKVKRLSATGLAKIKIPVPGEEEQARIVSILDKFDALLNDVRAGLPAELAARRKQYEYYRDKLLTFEESAT